MTNHVFVFKNAKTGELKRSVSYALIPAAKAIGIEATMVSDRWQLSDPWIRWECWTASESECLWHYSDNGECRAGKRQDVKP
jgi:hypothetical protein